MQETPESAAAAPVEAAPARFDTLPLDAKLLRAVADSGYLTMTPIQAKAIPSVLQGRDVMGAAQTGTGKTAAFSIPLLQRMHRSHNALVTPGTAIEPTTGEVHLRHHISPTGFYRGRKVLKSKADAA